ncbi:hypothetical protein DM01DRAFT_1407478 [Hesseltinella vesiculosa]|uniref:Uncharacterized protein n=1 Tax=Hesseltinella vesiculosa TaxID=101127 RepID=A0A1X2GHC1_9FUNG|nr:hypothetical protein DM01DRAFT_1407478 [Hesseltinella vesiculosa]
MTIISKEQAVCIYYGREYSLENAREAQELFRIEHHSSVDLCYTTDPLQPVAAKKLRIHFSPSIFHTYLSEATTPAVNNTRNVNLTKEQVMSFINQVYIPFNNELSKILYDNDWISSAQIHSSVSLKSQVIGKKSGQAFAVLAGSNKLHFLQANVDRRQNQRYYHLSILRPSYQSKVIQQLLSYDVQYQQAIQVRKNEGYQMIGYCRKSPATGNNNDHDNRHRLLTSSKFERRDRVKHQPILGDGDTADMLNMLAGEGKDIILTVLDYAGLTTNTENLKEFLLEYPRVKYIYVDRLPFVLEVDQLNTQSLLVALVGGMFPFQYTVNVVKRYVP